MEICVRGTQKHRGFKNRAILSHETYIAQERPQVLTEEKKTQGSFCKVLSKASWNPWKQVDKILSILIDSHLSVEKTTQWWSFRSEISIVTGYRPFPNVGKI